jgi:carbonic anhydrase
VYDTATGANGDACRYDIVKKYYGHYPCFRAYVAMRLITKWFPGCSWSPGTVEANIQADVAALKASPYLRNDMPVIGYVLDVATGQLREVR